MKITTNMLILIIKFFCNIKSLNSKNNINQNWNNTHRILNCNYIYIKKFKILMFLHKLYIKDYK